MSTEAEYQEATVEVTHGKRSMCDFMAAAGLGISGVGVVDAWRISYAPGVEVTYKTVEEAMAKVQAEMDRANHPTRILSFHVLAIHKLTK